MKKTQSLLRSTNRSGQPDNVRLELQDGAAHSKDLVYSKTSSEDAKKHNFADSMTPLRPHSAVTRTHNSTTTTIPQARLLNIPPPAPSNIPYISQPAHTVSKRGHTAPSYPNISRLHPCPRLHFHHLSELIDPIDLDVDSHVRSPSGNLLAPEQFLVHPDRPRSMRERQEEIRERVRGVSRLGVEGEAEEGIGGREKEEGGEREEARLRRRGRGCGCFG